jgi:hypothetical protein
METTAITSASAAIVRGSRELICTSRLRKSRPTPNAPAIPTGNPIASSTRERRSTKPQHWLRLRSERHPDPDLRRPLRHGYAVTA